MTETETKSKEVLILAATILASGMAFLDSSVVNIAIPSIQRDFSAAFGSLLWVVNAFPLVLASLLLISGSLSDRFGRKKIFALGIIFFTIASVFCALSSSILQLTVSRALQGVGAAMMIPGSLAIINISIPENRRGRAIGLWSGFSGGVAALGPFVGGFLVQHFSWHAIFYINVPLGIIAFLLTLYAVEESRNQAATSLDFWGTLLILLGLLGISFALMSAPVRGWHDNGIIMGFVGGIAAISLFAYAEMKAKQPLVPFSMFKSKLVLGANLATLFLYAALNAVIFFVVLNMQQVQKLSPIQAGLALLPAILIITFFSGYGGSIADKFGPRLSMIFGPLTVGIGMALLILPGTKANYFTMFMPGLILFGLGMSAVIAPLTKSALSVPHQYSGSASGVNNAVARIAALLAVAVLGGLAAIYFSANLSERMQSINLSAGQKQQILSQSQQMGGITIPSKFNPAEADIAANAVKLSFVHAFRIVMAINALLAFLAAVISFIYIRPDSS